MTIGISRLMDLLSDSREVIRNDVSMFMCLQEFLREKFSEILENVPNVFKIVFPKCLVLFFMLKGQCVVYEAV